MSGEESENKFLDALDTGVMPSADNVIAGEVQATQQQIPLGATHFAMFPQTNAILALVLAIASYAVCGLILSIPALLFAISAKKITDDIPTHPDRGIANAAYIAAIVNIVLSALLIVLYIGAVFFYLS
ncbi:MAG: hypothetical protein VX043_00940 [Candidatus Thermoplasmatota archaeon]|nr:hypothetical protein [Candidatus Thermoplasmatota archaeon]MEC8312517.1 hypothetical protein [Candidatus Thermoplasmatota archaeon]